MGGGYKRPAKIRGGQRAVLSQEAEERNRELAERAREAQACAQLANNAAQAADEKLQKCLEENQRQKEENDGLKDRVATLEALMQQFLASQGANASGSIC